LFGPQRISEWHSAITGVRAAYRAYYGRAVNLMRPRLYSEKMQWRKLFDLDPRFAILSDKIAARGFIADAAGAHYLPDLLLAADDPAAMALETLAPPYVLKSTHTSGQVLRVRRGTDFDVTAARNKMQSWLGSTHAEFAQ
jgi:hypothetical protein